MAEPLRTEILRLHLVQPLFFEPCALDPWSPPETDETLFCFEIDAAQCNEFEPDINYFPGKLIFAGKNSGKASGRALNGEPHGQVHQLGRGDYIFTQLRSTDSHHPQITKNEIINLAMEVQQEGLWHRLKLDSKFYLRYVFEDKGMAVQIFRPYE